MRVAHIIVDLDLGGAEQMLKRLLLAQPEAREKSLVVSLTSLGAIGQQLRERGYRVETLSWRHILSTPAIVLRLAFLLRRFRPDVVQTWMYHADVLGGAAARLVGINRVVWGIRNTRVPNISVKQRVGLAVIALLSHIVPKRIICAAKAGRESHVAAGFAASRMRVVGNGFDFVEFNDATGSAIDTARDAGPLVIGCIGRYHADKGQDVLIRAAAQLVQRHPNVQFVLVGRGCSPNNAELLLLLDKHGLRASFSLLGERTDVSYQLQQMDVFCMPSRFEGFPNALAEAMAMNRLCVATTAGDASEIAGDCAILVPPDDANALAAGLEQAITLTAAERYEIGARAGVRVRANHSMSSALSRYHDVYREVIEGQK